jgi:hypothetical protein
MDFFLIMGLFVLIDLILQMNFYRNEPRFCLQGTPPRPPLEGEGEGLPGILKQFLSAGRSALVIFK